MPTPDADLRALADRVLTATNRAERGRILHDALDGLPSIMQTEQRLSPLVGLSASTLRATRYRHASWAREHPGIAHLAGEVCDGSEQPPVIVLEAPLAPSDRGVCGVCGGLVQVRRDGMVRRHRIGPPQIRP